MQEDIKEKEKPVTKYVHKPGDKPDLSSIDLQMIDSEYKNPLTVDRQLEESLKSDGWSLKWVAKNSKRTTFRSEVNRLHGQPIEDYELEDLKLIRYPTVVREKLMEIKKREAEGALMNIEEKHNELTRNITGRDGGRFNITRSNKITSDMFNDRIPVSANPAADQARKKYFDMGR